MLTRFVCLFRGDGWYRGLLATISEGGEESFWTGVIPRPGAPGVGDDGRVTSLPLLELASCSRQNVLDYCDNAWILTETLFSALNGNETIYRR